MEYTQIAKFMSSLVEHQKEFLSLETEDATWVIKNAKSAIALMIRAVRDRDLASRLPMLVRSLPVWRTFKTGGVSQDNLFKDVAKYVEFGDIDRFRRQMCNDPALFYVGAEQEDTDFIILTPQNLGFREKPRTRDFMTEEFCARWSNKYLDVQEIKLCQPADAMQIRLQYQDQPVQEFLYTAMKRLVARSESVFNGATAVLMVKSVQMYAPQEQKFGIEWREENSKWDLGAKIVFRIRRKVPCKN